MAYDYTEALMGFGGLPDVPDEDTGPTYGEEVLRKIAGDVARGVGAVAEPVIDYPGELMELYRRKVGAPFEAGVKGSAEWLAKMGRPASEVRGLEAQKKSQEAAVAKSRAELETMQEEKFDVLAAEMMRQADVMGAEQGAERQRGQRPTVSRPGAPTAASQKDDIFAMYDKLMKRGAVEKEPSVMDKIDKWRQILQLGRQGYKGEGSLSAISKGMTAYGAQEEAKKERKTKSKSDQVNKLMELYMKQQELDTKRAGAGTPMIKNIEYAKTVMPEGKYSDWVRMAKEMSSAQKKGGLTLKDALNIATKTSTDYTTPEALLKKAETLMAGGAGQQVGGGAMDVSKREYEELLRRRGGV